MLNFLKRKKKVFLVNGPFDGETVTIGKNDVGAKVQKENSSTYSIYLHNFNFTNDGTPIFKWLVDKNG